jgi:hypothetical protein
MIEAGFSPKEVQVAAGHASITTTFDRYGHVMPGTLAGQRERLAKLDARRERATAPAREHAGSTDASERVARTGHKETKPRICGVPEVRPRGLEPPRAIRPTRPSTLRVYQFRHRRVVAKV